MGMGLVSEATAVELGIQTKEDGEARVGIVKKTTMMTRIMMIMMMMTRMFLGSTITRDSAGVLAQGDNPWIPSTFHHQVTVSSERSYNSVP